jgi:hypothetical protein
MVEGGGGHADRRPAFSLDRFGLLADDEPGQGIFRVDGLRKDRSHVFRR